ncbi:toxin TcdB middle/C-terminal domain-containing protein, partial [Morganella morganii]|uniref:toxin TcdB middle/C-terminal domain-containing protein n=1 Tax=Morganella morganii TaxID=582 RepID=UPI0034D489C8
PQRLDNIPALKEGAMLTDLDGDGRLQWVVTQPGVQGQYRQQTDNPAQWLHFTPLNALPLEYGHPAAQMTDIDGIGATDLVLIGPRSVRIWPGGKPGGKDGWLSAQNIPQAEKIVLPSPDGDAATLVAFSDVIGSGQQHLVQISADGVLCWPNLGHGRFGQPLALDGFSKKQTEFNAAYVYLADIDGSGTADILYARSDYIEIYRNRSGNGFDKPVTVKLPAGVRYDNTCRLQVADVQGLGVASLLLTVPHTVPRHYLLHLATEKPWLLNQINNQTGMSQTLHYRSSAQFRLDDKTREPVSYLPFPLHTLWRTETTDEITGNKLVSEARYHHGVWDAREREFRGFGCVETLDSDTAAARATSDVLTMPVLIRNWYATGYTPVDTLLKNEYWQGDKSAFTGFVTRLTTGSGDKESVCSDAIVQKQAFWLSRAQKGMQLRSEVYGKDGSPQQDLPYSVSEQRLSVRLITPDADMPVVRPSVSENREYHYERMAADPQCSQSVVLSADEYGYPLCEANINYPRRPKPAKNPLPDTLPASLFDSGYDDQQLQLIVSLSQHTRHHLTNLKQEQWLTGQPDADRSDIFV